MHKVAGWIKNALSWLAPWAELVIFAILIGLGWYFIKYRPDGWNAPEAASFAGALFGGAALLLGNWINRWNARIAAADLQHSYLIPITLELYQVALSLERTFETAKGFFKHRWEIEEGGMQVILCQFQTACRADLPPTYFLDGLGKEISVLNADFRTRLFRFHSSLVRIVITWRKAWTDHSHSTTRSLQNSRDFWSN